MKKKKIKLYDGYITINQDPTRAFDSDILHLRKNRTKKKHQAASAKRHETDTIKK